MAHPGVGVLRVPACLCTDRWQHGTNQPVGWSVQFISWLHFCVSQNLVGSNCVIGGCVPSCSQWICEYFNNYGCWIPLSSFMMLFIKREIIYQIVCILLGIMGIKIFITTQMLQLQGKIIQLKKRSDQRQFTHLKIRSTHQQEPCEWVEHYLDLEVLWIELEHILQLKVDFKFQLCWRLGLFSCLLKYSG